jgi:bacteriocin-like protein
MTNAINTSATSKQVRESTDRELTKEELDQVVGGSLSLNFTKVEYSYQSLDTSSAAPPAKHWFNGG